MPAKSIIALLMIDEIFYVTGRGGDISNPEGAGLRNHWHEIDLATICKSSVATCSLVTMR